MAEYMNKDRFLASMGLKGDETKYGNHDAEHQHRSYSTYMSYEIMDSVEDSIEEDVAPVVHGEWVNVVHALVDTTGYCTKCGKQAVWRTKTNKPYIICPNCGAKMQKEQIS